MHEFHGWVGLSSSTYEDEPALLEPALAAIRDVVSRSAWHDASFRIENLNGQNFLIATGMINRRREEGQRLDDLLAMVVRLLPGSWGLIYERDDESSLPPGPNAYRVRVIARGEIEERDDPFLSPCNPVIED
jgi:Immunity protein 7